MMHFLLLTMLPHLAVGKAENNLYSLPHCSPNNNPPKIGNSTRLPLRGLWEPVCYAKCERKQKGSQGKVSEVVNGLRITPVYGQFGLNPFFRISSVTD
jgi:hypothetical protein